MPKAELEPPDLKRCQAEITQSTPFRLGGPARTTRRCDNQPAYVITEVKPGEDGMRGSMALCPACLAEAEKKLGPKFFTSELIKAQR